MPDILKDLYEKHRKCLVKKGQEIYIEGKLDLVIVVMTLKD